MRNARLMRPTGAPNAQTHDARKLERDSRSAPKAARVENPLLNNPAPDFSFDCWLLPCALLACKLVVLHKDLKEHEPSGVQDFPFKARMNF